MFKIYCDNNVHVSFTPKPVQITMFRHNYKIEMLSLIACKLCANHDVLVRITIIIPFTEIHVISCIMVIILCSHNKQ